MDDLDNNDDDQRFRDWAEKVQVGDTEEGAQALREMIQDVRADRATARQAVQEELRAKEIQAEVQDAIAHFNKRYKRVGEDPLLRDAAQTALREELCTDLKEAGLPEDQLSSVRNDLGTVARLHGAARLAGRKVRTPTELMDATGAVLSEKFHIRPEPSGRTRQEVVADMRAERGLPARDDGTRRRQDIAQEARAARGVTAYQPRRVVQPAASSEAARAERSRHYVAAMRDRRHFPRPS